MKSYFGDYFAMPLSILVLIFFMPIMVFGGLKLATTLFGGSPICEVRK